MEGAAVANLQPKIAFPRSQLTTPNGARNLADGLVGPLRFAVHELYVLDPDHVVVVTDGLVNEVPRVLRQDRPSPSLPLQSLILQSMRHDYLEPIVFQGRF